MTKTGSWINLASVRCRNTSRGKTMSESTKLKLNLPTGKLTKVHDSCRSSDTHSRCSVGDLNKASLVNPGEASLFVPISRYSHELINIIETYRSLNNSSSAGEPLMRRAGSVQPHRVSQRTSSDSGRLTTAPCPTGEATATPTPSSTKAPQTFKRCESGQMHRGS